MSATVPGLLRARAADQPDRAAITTPDGRALTFGAWDRRSDAVARALLDLGVRRGEPVALTFDGKAWPEFAIACLAVQKAGGVALPLAAGLPAAQADDLRARAGARLSLSSLDGLETPGAPPPDLRMNPDDLAQIVFTSGTTGAPKAVAASHANLTYGYAPRPRIRPYAHSRLFAHAFPIGTNAAQMMLIDSLTAHPGALALPFFDAARFCALVAEHRIGTVFLVPPMAAELVRSEAYRGHDMSSVLLVSSSAAALPPATALELTRIFPAATVVNCYISTESAPARTAMIVDPSRPGSLGVPADPRDLRIARPDGSAAAPGEVGEVWLRCAAPPRAYLGEERADVFRDGWVRMGDLGRLDPDGHLFLVDRESDVIKCGGLKVSTVQVEAALHEHPAVVEAAVVGLPHPVMGAVVGAAVRTREPVTAAELKRFLAARLARHERPARIAFVADFARTTTGKILKPRVKELLAEVRT
ncbi:class I adenylate-forming enzyme family protein [Actinocorallia sp. A-T 12471]|uniref:class I adenylate-forming enzyme family protein n=1 Tax=Actinocorallia sp. A-T 12471 TaxID=3089813 RepID=UPI0029CF51E2|nr:class I adenylate-forming enzyme family protein [Actinocorallia sp. A-T 12471]MDX6739391.1 class I adenylate-forming enzyme family protein [Actinocorallia sp. A-T 12471]